MEFIDRTSTAVDPQKILQDLSRDLHGSYDFGFLFISNMGQGDPQKLIDAIKDKINVTFLVGCTCAGIIGSNEEIEYKAANTLILSKFPEAKITPFTITQNQLEDLKSPEDWYNYLNVYPNEKPKFFILPDPFSVDMNYFLKGINQSYPECPVIGGLASGATQARENNLFINQEIHDEGVIGLVLSGDFSIETIVSQGCKPIGETFIATKTDGNIVYELAGKPFVRILEQVLTKATARDRMLAQDAIFLGIAMDEYKHKLTRGDFLIRGLLGIDKESGAGVVADIVEQGQTIQFHVRDAQTATEDLSALLLDRKEKDSQQKAKGALVFSCNGRGEHLFREKNHDISLIQKHIGPIPIAGFFCAGEIGPVGGYNFLHGFTNSIALFYSTKG